MMTIVPVFIMPLFNKYEPLQDGQLKERIFALARKLHYPLTKLFVMDGSKRSSHSNAFMFGFGNNKRIVLFDTLMTQVDEGQFLIGIRFDDGISLFTSCAL
jgi:STE24 endopeptidase